MTGTKKRLPKTTVPTRAWQRMLSGRRLDLLDPSPLDIELEDIALGLAFVARWNGQTRGDNPFSVAEHSLLVERIAAAFEPGLSARWRLAALLHDAPEYVIGDMISPFKAAVGVDYKALEERLSEAVHRRFSLPPVLPQKIKTLIKRADHASAYFEAVQLAGFTEDEARRLFKRPRFKDPDLERLRLRPVAPSVARERFIARAEHLMKAMERGA
ncbi:MAG: HD family hydrolase [Alphaproteobacteria bacterium]|nr:MAG: HD family hydrolase [Alphaproteobacteria bacterium]